MKIFLLACIFHQSIKQIKSNIKKIKFPHTKHRNWLRISQKNTKQQAFFSVLFFFLKPRSVQKKNVWIDVSDMVSYNCASTQYKEFIWPVALLLINILRQNNYYTRLSHPKQFLLQVFSSFAAILIQLQSSWRLKTNVQLVFKLNKCFDIHSIVNLIH